jgi:predicted phosphodiesterase
LISQEKEGAIAGGRISGAFCEVAELDNVVVISDLHGDFECLARILEEVDYERFLRDETNKIVFLGDYVDRGANSVGVLHTVCQLKSRFPNSIILMRGNHEAPSEFPFSSHDFPFQLVERFGEDSGRAAYRKALLFFKELTVATTIQRELLLVHGGLPTNVEDLRDYRSLLASAYEKHTSNRIFAELLWNDPRQIESAADWEDSRRGIGRHFGARITKEWLRATGTKCVVRGHEPCQGFRIDHDGGVFTLFSCMRPYPAFKAAYLSISAKDLGNVRNASDLVPFVRFPRLL